LVYFIYILQESYSARFLKKLQAATMLLFNRADLAR
jgi:hypothetical protein